MMPSDTIHVKKRKGKDKDKRNKELHGKFTSKAIRKYETDVLKQCSKNMPIPATVH